MNRPSLRTLLAIHSAAVIVLTAAVTGYPVSFGPVPPLHPSALVFWGVIFFGVFFLIGQKVRPVPAADLVTGARLAFALVFYLLASAGRAGPLFALASAVLMEVADGLDGFLARRLGITRFGGIWDMESDAYVILLLSAGAVVFRGLPPWALLPGLIRYVFYFPFLALKPPAFVFPKSLSLFSKTVCVAAVFSLASAWYLPAAAPVAIAASAALLCVSFLWEAALYVSMIPPNIQARKR
jgi:phosphatidylglycerophosphate synthase